MSVDTFINRIRNITSTILGINFNAQNQQMSWLLFLKIYDSKIRY